MVLVHLILELTFKIEHHFILVVLQVNLKCICHKNGGVLVQHLKEHQLHCDLV